MDLNAAAPRTRVHLHIDRVVLRGLPPGQRRALLAGLRGELARLLAQPETLASLQSRHTPGLRATLPVAPDIGAAALGSRFATGLVQGLLR